MKKAILTFSLLLSATIVIAQTRRVLYVDSAGNNMISTTPLPQVAISGYFTNLLNKPTTMSGYGISDGVSTAAMTAALAAYVQTARTITINGITWDMSANRSWTVTSTPPTAGPGISVANNVVTNTAPDQVVTIAAGNGILISGSYPNFTIATVAPTIAFPVRTVNSSFTVSTTKPAYVYYTITCQVTNPLLIGNSVASAFLEYSTNAGSTWLPVSSVANSSGVGITVTVQLTNAQTAIIGGLVPANALVRIRTSTSGTATVSFVSAQEITY